MNQSYPDNLNRFFLTLEGMAALAVLIGLILFVLLIVFILRAWQVQTATFKLQQDLEEIKDHLMPEATNVAPVKIIPITERKYFKKPSKVFLAAVAVVLALFIVVTAVSVFVGR
ncbi:MAG: hypothetical protein JWN12_729 [Candidatus Saccharibacteria bacterium]|nr:hypothetical protein [Candidatus Saccharibacteria bacterium]